jgi:hypothetical protein
MKAAATTKSSSQFPRQSPAGFAQSPLGIRTDREQNGRNQPMKPLGCRLDRLFPNVSSHSAEADNRLIVTHTGNRLGRIDERNQGMDEG